MESVYPSTKRSALQLLAGYLERARQFEFLAGETKDDPRFKRMLLRQVVAYRMLAVKRADKLHLPIPPLTALRTARRKNRSSFIAERPLIAGLAIPPSVFARADEAME